MSRILSLRLIHAMHALTSTYSVEFAVQWLLCSRVIEPAIA